MLPINKITTSARWENLIESSLYLIFLDIDWKHSLEIDKGDVNNSLQIFNTKMTKLLDKHAPLKKPLRKHLKENSNLGYQIQFWS